MVRRINKKLVTFQFPFSIDNILEIFPAGEYTIETEEESISGSPVVHFSHVETVLVVRPPKGKLGPTSFWSIEPDALEKAIAKDADQCLAASSKNEVSDTKPSKISKSE